MLYLTSVGYLKFKTVHCVEGPRTRVKVRTESIDAEIKYSLYPEIRHEDEVTIREQQSE